MSASTRVSGLLAVAACSFGCAGSDTATGQRDGGRDGTAVESGGLLPSQLPPDFHCDPTIESIRDSIFLPSCAWDYCHGNQVAMFGLVLVADPPKVSAELVGRPSVGCPRLEYVVPGDPERSFLWQKLTEPMPACGERMPRGVQPLPPPALECIRQWIASL